MAAQVTLNTNCRELFLLRSAQPQLQPRLANSAPPSYHRQLALFFRLLGGGKRSQGMYSPGLAFQRMELPGGREIRDNCSKHPDRQRSNKDHHGLKRSVA